MFFLLNATTKPESDTVDRSICLGMTTSHHRIPVKGWKVTYTSALNESMENMPFECAAEALNYNLENGAGIWIVKGLRRERWGTLTGSLWEEESRINCSKGRLPSLSMGLRLQFQVKYQVWMNSTTKYLSQVLFSLSEHWVLGEKMKAYVSEGSADPLCQKHICRYLSKGLSFGTCQIAQGWQNIQHRLTHC